MPTRVISGRFVDPAGTPLAGLIVKAKLLAMVAIDGTVIAVPTLVLTTTIDTLGDASLSLIVPATGTAHWEIKTPKGAFSVHLAAGAATTFAALYVAVSTSTPQNAVTTGIDAHAAVKASAGTLGHIRIGAGLTIDADGIVTASGGGGGGVSDHGLLTGLGDDDHAQYLNVARGDARYYTETEADTLLAAKATTAALSGETTARTNADAALDTRVDALELAPPAHSHSAATTSAPGFMSATDKTKLDGVATGATANAADAQLRNRSTHTGTQGTATITGLDAALAAAVNDLADEADARATADTALDGRVDALELAPPAHAGSHASGGSDPITPAAIGASATGHSHSAATTGAAGFMSAADKTKLDGVAPGATANATDAQLRDRSTHTGVQAISTVSGLQGALDDKATQSALDAHTGAADPHTQYQKESERGAASGYASLDAGGIHPGAEMGTGFASIPAGKESFAFVNALRQWIVRDMLRLPEQASRPSATADQAVLYAYDLNGFTTIEAVDPTGYVYRIGGDLVRVVRNATGASIAKGKVVYISGAFSGGGVVPTVALARANSATTLPAIGMTAMVIANNAYGLVVTEGRVDDIDTSTSGAVDGQRVLVSAATAGEFTATVPSLPNHTQRLGVVIKSHASQGAILVDPQSVVTGAQGTANTLFSVGDGAAGAKTLRFLGAGAGDLVMTPTTARTLTLPDASGTLALRPTPQTTDHTATGTQTLNLATLITAGYTALDLVGAGGGGGGGGGAQQPSGTQAGGGGGGGSAGGQTSYPLTLLQTQFGDSITLDITIGAGGAGGAGGATAGSNGSNGADGGATTVAVSGSSLLSLAGGDNGSGGTTSGGAAGSSSLTPFGSAGAGGGSGVAGGGFPAVALGPGGGGGGGGVSTGNTAFAGGGGGTGRRIETSVGTGAAGTAGTSGAGGAGGNASAPILNRPGSGGGGGGAATAGVGGAGGTGTRGGGGGGGGASRNGFAGGAGGTGGPGFVTVIVS